MHVKPRYIKAVNDAISQLNGMGDSETLNVLSELSTKMRISADVQMDSYRIRKKMKPKN